MNGFAGVKWLETVCGIQLVNQNYRNITCQKSSSHTKNSIRERPT